MVKMFFILFFITVFSYTVQALSGFGSIIIAVTLAAHFYPIRLILPIIVPLDVILNSYLVIRYRKCINYSVILKSVIPIMGSGLVIGIFLFNNLADNWYMEKLFGLFVVSISLREIWILWRKKLLQFKISPIQAALFLFSGGIIHGLFASGGPMVVYPMSKRIQDKTVFRSSLAFLWLVFNLTLTTSYIIARKINTQSLKWTAGLLVIVPVSIFIGEKLHGLVNELKFRLIIFVLLLFSGFAVLIKL